MKIFAEMKLLSPTSFIACVIVAYVTYSQGLQFSMDTIPDFVSCGQLYCWIDEDLSNTNIFSIGGLSIFYLTPVNISVKLASMSIFDTHLDVQNTEIIVLNATGSISRYHAEMVLALKDTNYCRNVSFMCELDFMNTTGEADVLRKSVSPGTSTNCHEIEKDNVELRNEIMALKTELSKLQEIINSTHDAHQVHCFRGVPHDSPRAKFFLWGNVIAWCDTETDGGGWIVIQRRTKGDVDFYRGWEDYKKGFGTPDTDFWIGNEVIHNLTSSGYTELRVDMEYQGKQYFAHYSHFDVAAETSLYRLSVSGYSGTAGDGLDIHDGRRFSTFDKDNDDCSCYCAIGWGAWWYNGNISSNCHRSNLNGKWGAQDMSGVAWAGVVYPGSVSMSEMKVRHV